MHHHVWQLHFLIYWKYFHIQIRGCHVHFSLIILKIYPLTDFPKYFRGLFEIHHLSHLSKSEMKSHISEEKDFYHRLNLQILNLC
jgi:hypothetical protein